MCFLVVSGGTGTVQGVVGGTGGIPGTSTGAGGNWKCIKKIYCPYLLKIRFFEY